MSNVVVVGGLACLALVNDEICIGSNVQIDADLGESVVANGCVGAVEVVLNDRPVVGGHHVTGDVVFVLITDGKHGSAVF
jgi:hypothetical protein